MWRIISLCLCFLRLAQGLLAYYSLCRIQEADYAWVTLVFLIISAFCACFLPIICLLTRDKTFHISVSTTFTTSFALDSMYFYGVIGKLVKCDPPPTLEERRIVDPSSEATHRQSHLRDSEFPSRWPANRACPTRTHHSQLLVLGVPRILDVWPTRKPHIQFPVFNIPHIFNVHSVASIPSEHCILYAALHTHTLTSSFLSSPCYLLPKSAPRQQGLPHPHTSYPTSRPRPSHHPCPSHPQRL